MSKMYLVQGVHPVVPGCPRSLWFTAEGANKAAAELVNILLEDWRRKANAKAEDWQARLNAARTAKRVSENDADVWIEELTPGDAPPPPPAPAGAEEIEDAEEARTFCDRCGCWRGPSNGWGWNNEPAPAEAKE
jgi:hypothetical protein